MISRFSAIRIALVLSFVALLMVACSATVGKKIVKYCDKGTSLVNRLADDNLVAADEAKDINTIIADVRAAGVEYDGIEQALRAAQTADEKATLRDELRAVGQRILDAVRRLDSEGLTHIKNEKARKRLQDGLALAEIVIDVAT